MDKTSQGLREKDRDNKDGNNNNELGPVVEAVPRVTESIAKRSLVSWLSPVEVADRVRRLLDTTFTRSVVQGDGVSVAPEGRVFPYGEGLLKLNKST